MCWPAASGKRSLYPSTLILFMVPRGGISDPVKEETKRSVSAGLKRIEGQVRGIQKMLDEDRYCIDVLTQLQAARAALHRVEEAVLRDHVHGCVTEAFASGDAEARQTKMTELVAAIGRMTR